MNRAWKEEAAKFDNQHNDPDAVEKLLWQGMDDNEFQSTYSINVNGVYFFSTRMVPLLRKGTAPTVIVIASIAGLMLQRQVISSLVAFHADIEQDRWSVVIPHFQGELSRFNGIADEQAASLHCASLLASRFTPQVSFLPLPTFEVTMLIRFAASKYGSIRSSLASSHPK